MTETEQRIAIAGWCGFKRCPIHLGYECCGNSIPDYLHDLNAMHEAEKHLHGSDYEYHNDPVKYRQWHEYQYHLMSFFGCSATAAQRAKSLLKTIGKWKD